jgi:DNA invertase Pin-like site-specific DNA recombinase
MKRAFLYARYSSKLQSPCSIEDQFRLCESRVEREGWTVVGRFQDAAISGATDHRPGYQAMMAAARQTPPPCDVIVVEGLDRLTRDNAEATRLYQRLQLKRIDLIGVSDGIDTRRADALVHVGFKGLMNAAYLQNLGAQTRRGLSGRVESGHSAGGRCFGFRAVPSGFEIEPREAVIVRRIFEAYANGRSLKAIAHRLNTEGVSSPTGRAGWGASTLRLVLRNERYRGVLVWNRDQFVKDPDTGRRRALPRPPGEWLRKHHPDLRIVEEDLWLAAHRRIEEVREAFGPGRPKGRASRAYSPTLLSGVLTCGPCGAAMIGQAATRKTGAMVRRYAYYRCGAAADKGAAVCSHSIGYRQDRLEAAILAEFRRAMTPLMVEHLTMMVNARVEGLCRQQHARVEESKAEIFKLEREAANLVAFLRDGREFARVRDELVGIEAALAALRLEQQKLFVASPLPPPKVHPAWIQTRLDHLDELLQGDPDRARAEILKHLPGALSIAPLPQAGRERRAVISGAIAPEGLLTINAARDPMFFGGYSAGPRNHRNRARTTGITAIGFLH